MIRQEEVYKIGKFNKPHGIHGELQFTFTDDVFDATEECEYFVCMLDGILVPFFYEEYRFRSETTALVKLEGIDSAEKARMFTNIDVYFPLKYKEEDDAAGELTWHYFLGFDLYDVQTGYLGKITDVDDSTVNILLVVEHEGDTLLIPAQEHFIVALDNDSQELTMVLPEGLIDIDDLPAVD